MGPDEGLAAPARTPPEIDYDGLVAAITQAHDHAQRQAVQAVNLALTLRNWLIGYHIVEYQQHGSDRARYGERLLETLARDLRPLVESPELRRERGEASRAYVERVHDADAMADRLLAIYSRL